MVSLFIIKRGQKKLHEPFGEKSVQILFPMSFQDLIQSGYTTETCQTDARSHQHSHLPPRSHSPLPITSERAWAGTPSLEGPRSLPDSGRASPCMRDGEFFLRLLQTEVERMEGWCQNMEREAEDNELPEESEFGRKGGDQKQRYSMNN